MRMFTLQGGGADWDNSGGFHADHHRAAFAPSDTSIVYTCNDGGVYRSENKGALFEKAGATAWTSPKH